MTTVLGRAHPRGLSVVACCLAVVLTSCGSQRADGAGAGTATAASGVPASSSAGPEYLVRTSEQSLRIAARVQADYQRWAGGLDVQRAAQVVLAYSSNADQAECVADRGLRWHWERAIGPAETRAYFEGRPLVTPPARVLTYDDQVNAEVARLEALRGISPPKGVDEALNVCSGQIDSAGPLLGHVSEEGIGAYVAPEVVTDLHIAWTNLLDTRLADLPSRTVGQCLDSAGLDRDLADQVEDAVPDPSEIPIGSEPSTQAWDHALSLEATWVRALWDCHRKDYDEAMTRLAAASADFRSAHAEEITQAEASWQRTVSLARRMGWTPDRPLGEYDPRAELASAEKP